MKEYKCQACGTKAEYAPGIGHYCPKKGCKNADFGLEETTVSKSNKNDTLTRRGEQ